MRGTSRGPLAWWLATGHKGAAPVPRTRHAQLPARPESPAKRTGSAPGMLLESQAGHQLRPVGPSPQGRHRYPQGDPARDSDQRWYPSCSRPHPVAPQRLRPDGPTTGGCGDTPRSWRDRRHGRGEHHAGACSSSRGQNGQSCHQGEEGLQDRFSWAPSAAGSKKRRREWEGHDMTGGPGGWTLSRPRPTMAS